MKQVNTKKRAAGVAGLKALIAAGSVAATLVGWALLPANDPQPVSATAPSDQQQPPALSVPGTGDSQQVPADPFQVPSNNQSLPSSPNTLPSAPDNSQLPQVQPPQGFSRSPLTRSRSSR
jgi:hypothetical protein